jgi:hypothetical protein
MTSMTSYPDDSEYSGRGILVLDPEVDRRNAGGKK